MQECIYAAKDCRTYREGACNVEEMPKCGEAIAWMVRPEEDCPFMVANGFKGDAAKCEIPFFRKIVPPGIACGSSIECRLETVPEVRSYIMGRLDDAKRIQALSRDKAGIKKVIKAMIRDLSILPMVSDIDRSHKLAEFLSE